MNGHEQVALPYQLHSLVNNDLSWVGRYELGYAYQKMEPGIAAHALDELVDGDGSTTNTRHLLHQTLRLLDRDGHLRQEFQWQSFSRQSELVLSSVLAAARRFAAQVVEHHIGQYGGGVIESWDFRAPLGCPFTVRESERPSLLAQAGVTVVAREGEIRFQTPVQWAPTFTRVMHTLTFPLAAAFVGKKKREQLGEIVKGESYHLVLAVGGKEVTTMVCAGNHPDPALGRATPWSVPLGRVVGVSCTRRPSARDSVHDEGGASLQLLTESANGGQLELTPVFLINHFLIAEYAQTALREGVVDALLKAKG